MLSSFANAFEKHVLNPKIPADKVCQYYAAHMEKQHSIPQNLLLAISITESGKQQKKGFSPWPWTINVLGKGYYFSTKQEAVRAVKQLQKKGVKSIDVGCMQINLSHHPNAFQNIEQALDPKHNMTYGAKLLKNLKKSHQSWRKAVARYHSSTSMLNAPYQKKVLENLAKLKQNHHLKLQPQTHLVAAKSSSKESCKPCTLSQQTSPSLKPRTFQYPGIMLKKSRVNDHSPFQKAKHRVVYHTFGNQVIKAKSPPAFKSAQKVVFPTSKEKPPFLPRPVKRVLRI